MNSNKAEIPRNRITYFFSVKIYLGLHLRPRSFEFFCQQFSLQLQKSWHCW